MILISQSIFAQETALVLSNKNSNSEKVLYEKHKIIVVHKNGETLRSNFTILSDSSIFIDNDTILLSEIEIVNFKSSSLNTGGGIFAAGGMAASLLGGALLFSASTAAEPISAAILIIMGVPVAAAGVVGVVAGIAMLAYSKDYNVNDWELTIR